MSTSPVTELRDNLSEIIDAVSTTGEEWVVTKHGRPVAVILSADEYESLIETVNILSDDDTLTAIREGLADLDAEDVPEA